MKTFNFTDINLVPKMGIVSSRSECDTKVQLGKHSFEIPVIPANMSSVITEKLAINLAFNNFFYVIHRFGIDSYEFVLKMKNLNLVSSISIGVNEESYELLKKFDENNIFPDFITIDIAHGHCIKMETILKFIRSNEKFNDIFIIAGNISTVDACNDLYEWGADAIKAGIGPGAACTTAHNIGFGSRGCQPSMIKMLSEYSKCPIIADGGITFPSDINKSLVMGAKMVMCGSLLTGCLDSPGDIIEENGKSYKEYYGSASQFQSGKSNRIEGTKKLIELKDKKLVEQMGFLKECIQSAISYGGGKDLSTFDTVEFILKS